MMNATMRRPTRSCRPSTRGFSLVAYGVAVVLVPLGITLSNTARSPRGPAPVRVEPTPEPSAIAPSVSPATEQQRALAGIWSRYEAGAQGERIRFYYFHGDGTGLYRYGRVGLSHTHSFDYDVVEGRLILDFRKTGDHHEVEFSLERGAAQGERDWLSMKDDPREAGTTRYFRESTETVRGPAQQATQTADGPGLSPAGHMWIDLRHYATGGQGFALYQFRPAGIDGRGVGWFHRGDFNDWTTEWLTYRVAGDRLELDFTLAGIDEVTGFSMTEADGGQRVLVLDDDPRDFWHEHRYLDMGPSFGSALAPFELWSHRP